ncbi:Aste57867_12383 [Aphanomyces stellatus]|uniref:Aste57867_12383 protein n=1 Tax=Aphanomyces stellatus TaxID=120398 RepID=A0A485KVG3_9STRA|nr:hypothetical protein As57867_012337 [Aphanomyces stellatus]VFT89234.1 Aste57867_12383 [Aphanomyces stellatus]
MDDSLYDSEYDAIIVGTGIVESIVAASLARAGKKVLHLDTNDYYGSNYASLHLHQFEEWSHAPSVATPSLQPHPLESTFHCTLLHHAKDDAFQPRSSSFSLDIQPKMLLSNSPLVDVLVESGVGRYLDFMAMQGTYMFSARPQNKNPPIWEVPCSKTDVFKSKLNVMEKRHLMKFLQFVADYGPSIPREEDVTTLNERDLTASRALKRPQNKQSDAAALPTLADDASFTDVLATHFKLSTALQQVVLYGVLLRTTPPSSNEEGLSIRASLDAIYAFVTSIGKFAPSPYLTPMYGISEVAQSFCRLSAVYNGIYVLRAPVSHLAMDEEVVDDGADTSAAACVGVATSDGRICRASHVVVNGMFGRSVGCTSPRALLRGIFVVNTPIQPNIDRLVLVIPPGEIQDSDAAIHVVQMDATMGVCPEGLFLVHVTTVAPAAMPADELVGFMLAIQTHVLRDVSSPPVWTSVFTIPLYATTDDDASTSRRPANVFVVAPPVALDTTLDTCVREAKAIFDAICPGHDFLPKSATAEQVDADAVEDDDVALLHAAAQLIQTDESPTGADPEATTEDDQSRAATTPVYDL